MVFNNVGHNVLNIQTGSPYLLRNEAGGCHSRSGIDFEHIDFFTFCDDVIHAHDTLASQYVVMADVSCCTRLVNSGLRRAGVISVTSPLYLAL